MYRRHAPLSVYHGINIGIDLSVCVTNDHLPQQDRGMTDVDGFHSMSVVHT